MNIFLRLKLKIANMCIPLTICSALFFSLFVWFLAALGLRCCARAFSLAAASGGYSSLWCAGLSLWWLLLLQSTGSRCVGFSSSGTWAQQLCLMGSRAQAQQLWRTDLVAPQHVGYSWTRARTHVPCNGRQILNHCTTSEVPQNNYFEVHLCYFMYQ